MIEYQRQKRGKRLRVLTTPKAEGQMSETIDALEILLEVPVAARLKRGKALSTARDTRDTDIDETDH